MDIILQASRTGNTKRVKNFIKQKDFIDENLLFYIAIYLSNYKLVIPKIDPICKGAQYFLTKCSVHGYHKLLHLLLKKGTNPNNVYNTLELACRNNKIKCMTLLLKYGANIHIKNSLGYTLGSVFLDITRYYSCNNLLNKYIILIPFVSRKFTKINENIIRETASYL
jgi:hypothetical protein